MKPRRLLQVASILFLVLSGGHLVLVGVGTATTLASWAGRGFWATVPLGRPEGPAATVDALAFWAGVGSFAVPLITLGLLLWHLAARDIRVPALVGWIAAAWSLVGAVLMVPSPFILGMLAGVLVVVAARPAKDGQVA